MVRSTFPTSNVSGHGSSRVEFEASLYFLTRVHLKWEKT